MTDNPIFSKNALIKSSHIALSKFTGVLKFPEIDNIKVRQEMFEPSSEICDNFSTIYCRDTIQIFS